MRIKKVVAQGFKTYAKKTEFIFDPGVTAIVGPNGSGKSNVSDAIRWCLGEQSYSLLRSKKTSDIIFSGSDRKSRLGMAQVTVTLENDSGEIPVDFSEIEITRRAYRDGNNEYLLNGQRVRLQDITEILAPTGLGKRTYALIGQGLIERVLSLAPESLRSLFEEAAGITQHQSKRGAALRRLDAARLNLTRVNDITAEISPRLDTLRRQAERTDQRNHIADELSGMLEDWYGYQWHGALQKLNDANSLSNTLEQRVTLHRTTLAALASQIEDKRSAQSDLRAKLGELHTISSEHHREAERIGRELAVAQERLRQITARTEASRQELAPLNLEKQTLEERIVESNASLKGLQVTVGERNAEVDALQATIAERQQARRELHEDVTAKRQQAVELQTTITRNASRIQQMETRCSDLQTELAIEQDAEQEASERISNTEARIANRREQHGGLEAKCIDTTAQIGQIEASISELQVVFNKATEQRQLADREVDRLQTRFDLLSRLRREGAGYANGVQAILQAADANRLQGIRGTVASVVDVPAHLDKAIATTLGGAYQNVITSSWSHAQDAIEYLTKSGSGRATFLPLDKLHVMQLISAPNQQGIIGNAAELVDYDSDVAEAVQQLLNRVWVAEDLNAARRALDGIQHGPRPTVVTLRGEIIRPGGAVSGGTDSRRRDQSVLSREREYRELPEQIETAIAQAAHHSDVCKELVARIEAHQSDLPQIQDLLNELNKQDRIARAELTELEKSQERSSQTRDWHSVRINQIRAELDTSSKQQDSLREELEAKQNDYHHAEEALKQAQSAAEAGGVSELLRHLADLRANAAGVQGDLQSQNAVLHNQQRNLHAANLQITARERQVAQFAAESSTLADSIASLGDQENKLGGLIAGVQAKIQPAEESLSKMEADQSHSEAEERALQERLRKDETGWNTAQLAAERSQDAIDQLRRNIEMEFSLVFLDESEEAESEESTQPSVDVDSIIQHLPALEEIPEELDDNVRKMRRSLSRLKNVNPDAPREYAEAAERCEFLENQSVDLEKAIADLHEIIAKLDTLMAAELTTTFSAVSEQFVHFFNMLFNGGTAKLSLTDSDSIITSGVEIIARPPGKRPQTLALLSGGERTLTACALIFAILRVSPTPFCVLDEVDAALDEANVDRFRYALEELSAHTQFILITHNRRTLEGTNAIYGVTMSSDGVSRVISLKLEGERIVRGASNESSAQDDDDGLADIVDIVDS